MRIAPGLAALAMAVATLLFALRPLSLSFPGAGLDSSWMTVLGQATTWPARWGIDLVFTYGPTSALTTRYFTDNYLVAALPILVGVALVAGACAALLARFAAGERPGAVVLVLVAMGAEIAGLAAELAQDQDSFYFALGLGLLLLDLMRSPKDRFALLTLGTGVALFGALALTKTSYGILALGMVVLADAQAVLARRRAPLLTAVFLAAFLVAFVGCGQRIGDLPAYISLQYQVASGYGEAMYLAPSHVEFALFLSGGAALVAVVGLCGLPGRGGRLFAALGTAYAVAIAVKAGFIRADTHSQIAWSLLGLSGLFVAVGPALRRSKALAAAVAVASLLVLWVVAPLFLLADTGRRPTLDHLAEVYSDMELQLATERDAWGRYVQDPSAFAEMARRAKDAAWANIRTIQPLPHLDGSVDMLPSDQSAVLANELEYYPRPSFQEYSTYTAKLIGANGAFYAKPDAPRWVIFGMGTLDDRYPTSIEGALWPELLRRYEPARRVGDWVALRRREEALPDVLGQPVQIQAKLGERVVMPSAGPVFARVTVQETLLGRLAAIVFRPPALVMRVVLVGGGEGSYRFIPAMAAAGFLLSPIVRDAEGFADLGFGHGDKILDATVASMTVFGSPWARFFYDSDVLVELRPVAVPIALPSADAKPFADELARTRPWRRFARLVGGGSQVSGNRLSAPPSSPLTVLLAAGNHLRVGFGVYDRAWKEGETQGVCFALKASPDASVPFWRRCLDPQADQADRGPQSAKVDLPTGTAAVTAETNCSKSCDWRLSYWSEITAED